MLSTTDQEKRILERAIETRKAPRVLEIGAFKGETTRVLAGAARRRDGYVVVLDPMRWSAEVSANGLLRHLPMAGVATRAIDMVLGDASYEPDFWRNVGAEWTAVHLYKSLSGAPELIANRAAELGEFDVVFIDGDHSYEGARRDLFEWGTRTAAGGTLFVHDAVDRFPGVLDALADFERVHGVRVTYPREGSLASIEVSHTLARGASPMPATRERAAEAAE